MPIAQGRVLALIAAYDASTAVLDGAKAEAAILAARVRQSDLSPAEAWALIHASLAAAEIPAAAATAVAIERAHFRRFATRNERERERQAQRRQGTAAPPARPEGTLDLDA